MNEIKDPTQKFQISVSGDRVMEYNKVEDSYLPRTWKRFKTLKEFKKFVSSKAFNDFKINDVQEILLISQDSTNLILHLAVVPEISSDEHIVEHVFDSEKEASDFVEKNNLLPSSNLLDEPAREQINKFFSGEKCFFEGAAQLYQEYISQKDKLEASDVRGEFILGRKYEQKVVDILIKY